MTLGVTRGGKKEDAFRKRALPSVAPRDEDLVPPTVGLGPLRPLEQGLIIRDQYILPLDSNEGLLFQNLFGNWRVPIRIALKAWGPLPSFLLCPPPMEPPRGDRAHLAELSLLSAGRTGCSVTSRSASHMLPTMAPLTRCWEKYHFSPKSVIGTLFN